MTEVLSTADPAVPPSSGPSVPAITEANVVTADALSATPTPDAGQPTNAVGSSGMRMVDGAVVGSPDQPRDASTDVKSVFTSLEQHAPLAVKNGDSAADARAEDVHNEDAAEGTNDKGPSGDAQGEDASEDTHDEGIAGIPIPDDSDYDSDDGVDRKASAEEKATVKAQKKKEHETLYPRSVAQRGHILVRQRIAKGYSRYAPWDPSSYTPPPLRAEDIHNYFFVDMRRNLPAEEPKPVLRHFSKTLQRFLRKIYGEPFYYDSVEQAASNFFMELKDIKSKLAKAEAALDPDMPLKDQRAVAIKMGCSDAKNDEYPTEHIVKYLGRVVEQVTVLLEYLLEQYRPVEERLKLYNSFDHVSFDLLGYYFQEDMCLQTVDDVGQKIAFNLYSRYYHTDSNGRRWFAMRGTAYFWDGHAYVSYKIKKELASFQGTKELNAIEVVVLNDAVERELVDRGRLYASYSGIHYKTYHGHRVIVDRQAWDREEGYDRPGDVKIPDCPEDKLHLLPSQVHGWNLSEKKWASFFVTGLEPVIFDENAWDHLVLAPKTKKLIKGLVSVTRNSNSSGNKIISDVISGKSGGLISVLHGPPGTGKTLTAEAVAEHLKRPLYMVGSSELSTSPSTMESSLRSILKLATTWDAALLIDEADVFLEQRSLHEIQRNALVSAALRLLEYHRGVLFLTTNRIKTFDEAFLSRFSIAIKFPELDQSARLSIWTKFFQLAGCYISKPSSPDGGNSLQSDPVVVSAPNGNESAIPVLYSDLEDLAAKPFNGRTIKNLVRTAQALALSEEEPFAVEHVQVVVEAQEKFLRDFAST